MTRFRGCVVLAVLFCARAAFGATPVAVPTNTALQNVATITYPGGLWRDTFGNGNGAPPLYYMPSNSACSLAAGAGDNGSQVKSADGKCWLAQFPASGMDVRQFGAGPGVADNTAALNAAMAAAATVFTNGGIVIFGPGVYLFTGSPSVTLPNVQFGLTLKGAGMNATYLQWNTAINGLTVNYGSVLNSVHIRDIAFLAGTTNSTGTAITLNQTNPISASGSAFASDLTNVTIRGADGIGLADYWKNGVAINSVSNVSFTNLLWSGSGTGGFNGIGIDLLGTTVGVGVVYNIVNSIFLDGSTGLILGNDIQGVSISASNFTGSNVCINSNGTTGMSQLTVLGSQFNCIQDDIDTAIQAFLNVSNNVFYVNNGFYGIKTTGAQFDAVVSGNAFDYIGTSPPQGGTGIGIFSNTAPFVVSSNNCNSIATCIFIDSTASNINMSNNINNGGTLLVNNGGVQSYQPTTAAWTPTLIGSTTAGSPTYTGRFGTYFVASRRVTVDFNLTVTALGGAVGNLQITNLPFTEASGASQAGPCFINAWNGFTFPAGYTQMAAEVPGPVNYATVQRMGSGQAIASVLATDVTSFPMYLTGSCSYQF